LHHLLRLNVIIHNADRQSLDYNPHMPIGKMWMYRLLFVCFMFVRLRISPERIKLAASNLTRWFRGTLGRESPILGNFAPTEAQNRTNRRTASGLDVGSACVNNRQSPSLTILVSITQSTSCLYYLLPDPKLSSHN